MTSANGKYAYVGTDSSYATSWTHVVATKRVEAGPRCCRSAANGFFGTSKATKFAPSWQSNYAVSGSRT
jgi:hypothetical protein